MDYKLNAHVFISILQASNGSYFTHVNILLMTSTFSLNKLLKQSFGNSKVKAVSFSKCGCSDTKAGLPWKQAEVVDFHDEPDSSQHRQLARCQNLLPELLTRWI